MKFKSEIFLDEGDATRIALYLRSNSPKNKHKLFKAMSPRARLMAIKMEKEKKKLPKTKEPKEMPTVSNTRTFRDDPLPQVDKNICGCGGYKYADADQCENCSYRQQGWV